MGFFYRVVACCLLVAFCATLAVSGEPWPQFRGPNASGRMEDGPALPVEVGPERNLIWKTALPPGHSSPAVFEDRIYLTAVDKDKLLTIAIDADEGSVLWQQEAPHDALERIHNIGSHAQPSPATDGEVVVSFFGSSGLSCYDREGNLLWQRRMGPFINIYGAASSPIIVDDKVILNQDQDMDAFLLVVDKKTGETVWRADRSEFPSGYSTPVLWEGNGQKQIVVAGAIRAIGYGLETGKEIWTVTGLGRISNMTPVVGDDGMLYIAMWSPGGDAADRIYAEPFDDMAREYDKDQSGTLERAEIPPGPVSQRFDQIDRNKNGKITRAEYDWMEVIFNTAYNVILAIRPDGEGDITKSHVLWKYDRFLPYVPTPVQQNGTVWMVKNGGILSSLDATSGQPIKTSRLPDTGDYYSSPVVADGKLYIMSQKGKLSVVSAQPNWEVLATNDFGEDNFATPAIADGRIYIRTDKALYCFGKQP